MKSSALARLWCLAFTASLVVACGESGPAFSVADASEESGEDTALGEEAEGDSATTDSATTDSATADSATADSATTDSATADSATAADSLVADTAIGDTTADTKSDATGDTAPSSLCAAAIDVTAAVAGGGTYVGTTSGSTSMASTCSTQTSAKVVLKLTLATYGNFRLDITSNKPATDPSASSAAVFVRSSCDQFTSELMCNPSADTKSTFFGTNSAGVVYVIVDGDYFAAGFTLKRTALGAACNTDLDCRDFPGAKCNVANGACIAKFACPAGTGDCDGNPANGCETDTTTSMKHCGGCFQGCDATGANVTAAACTAGVCKLTCTTNRGNCDGKSTNGCESDFQNDGWTCGSCTNSCNGGVCAGGSCANVGQMVTTIAGADRIRKLGLSSSNVYVLDDRTYDQVWAAPKGAAVTATSLATNVEDIATDSAGVWIATVGDGIKRQTTGAATAFTSGPGNYDQLETDGTNLFLFSKGFGTNTANLYGYFGGSPTPTPLFSATSRLPGRLTIAGSQLVFRTVAESGSAWSSYSTTFFTMPKTGGTAATFGTLSTQNAPMVGDGSDVFYGGRDGLKRIAVGGSTATSLWNEGEVRALAVDATNVYFAGCPIVAGGLGHTRVYRVAKSGGPAVQIGYDPVGSNDSRSCNMLLEGGTWLAVDGTHVYWAAQTFVRRMAK